jgi:hypothetical protein
VLDIEWALRNGNRRNTYDLMPDGRNLVILRPLQSKVTTVKVLSGWRPF